MDMTLTKKEPMWTLEDGLKVIRELDVYARQANFHLALGGSVS